MRLGKSCLHTVKEPCTTRHDPTSYLLACPYPTTFEISDLINVSFYYQCAVGVVIISSAEFPREPLNTKIYTTLSQKSSNRLAKKVTIVSNTKRLYHRPKHLLTKSLFCLLETSYTATFIIFKSGCIQPSARALRSPCLYYYQVIVCNPLEDIDLSL